MTLERHDAAGGDTSGVRIGTQLGHFRIIELVGRGGMGVVYRAIDDRLGRTVALKVLPDDVAAEGERRRRFLREAKLAATVNHPNIATVQ